jgi:hypothetical protein
MISQSLYRTGLPMVDLFFKRFATMIEMQLAFVSGGMITAPVSSKLKTPIQPRGEIARDASKEVETARDTGVKAEDHKKAQVRPEVQRAGRIIRATAGKRSRGLVVIQNPGKSKNHPNRGGDTKLRGTHKN